MSTEGSINTNGDGNPAHVSSVLEALREQVRSRRARLHLTDPGNPRARSLAELRRSAEAVNEVWFVSAHLPINWRVRIAGRLSSYAKRAVRILLRWYINPIVEQQNRFNSATARTISELVTYQERMAREWLLLDERITKLEMGTRSVDAIDHGPRLENQEWEHAPDARDS